MGRKQVKLPPSKSAKNNAKKRAEEKDKGGFFFFVKDQGEGAGKVAVIVLKILELVLTTIFALVLGIFAPLCIWNGDIVAEEVAADPSAVWWLISSVVYIIGLFVLMFGHSKIATAIHIAAAVGTLITYSCYLKLFEGFESNGPTALYMPSLFITLITIAIMLIINIPKWIDRHIKKVNEVAPSILGDKKK
ncbi:MAG: hypothetical protein K2J80_05415 [Oscillospiraceae bacterium]|nr:hypothetical protein [Oscillospiraceae bacterium]